MTTCPALSRRSPWPVQLSALALATFAPLGGALHAATSPPQLGPDHRVQLLSPPSSADPLDIASDYLAAHAADLGLGAADVSSLVREKSYGSDTIGTSVHYQQKVNGIPVFNAITDVQVLASGAILTVTNTAVSGLAGKLSTTVPLLTAAGAYTKALSYVGKSGAVAVPLMPLEAARQGVAFSGVGATQRPVPVRLIYVERADGLVRLAWEVYAKTAADQVWYLHVDAVDGALLTKQNLVSSLDQFRVYPFNSESPISTESPVDLHHDLAAELDDLEASPVGWITAATTSGNNVDAVEDRDDDYATFGYQPAGVGAPGGLVFDYRHDDSRNPCEQPTPLGAVASNPANLKPCDAYSATNHNTNLDAAIVNLFYWNNVMHDVMWHYGFTEGAGNFQATNFTTEGTWRDVDQVYAQAQDGSGTNNANFFTPPDDGVTPLLLPPEMQMYEWSPPGAVRVNVPTGFHDFDDGDAFLTAGTASFGASLADLDEAARTGDLELADDGTGTVNDGCEALVGFTPGKIALIDRGTCEFGVKVLNAENAGAKAAILANIGGQEVGIPMGPGAVGAQVTIPSVMIGQTNGSRLKSALAAGTTNVTLQILPVPNRDSDLDAGVIAHEYGHGISNRLIGHGTSIACLINAQQPDPNNPGALIPIGEQMGEGWSDFYAMTMTAQRTDTGNTPRGVGAYISYQNENGPGIRRYPYTRNLAVNPYTYADVATETAPHGVGSVWATMIWDMYWNLVDTHGFEPDLLQHESSAGNVRALHLVNDGIVLTKCRPSFVDGRNGILLAEAADGNTDDSCTIWRAFARRGLGVAAANPTLGEDHRQVVEDFTMPAYCASAGNLAPEARGDAYATKRNTALKVAAPGVLANDVDPDGTPITAHLIAGPSNAKSFTLRADGSFDYVPKAGFTGADSFTYVAQDGEVSSSEATVTIDVKKK